MKLRVKNELIICKFFYISYSLIRINCKYIGNVQNVLPILMSMIKKIRFKQRFYLFLKYHRYIFILV